MSWGWDGATAFWLPDPGAMFGWCGWLLSNVNINTKLISHNNVERSDQIPAIVYNGRCVFQYVFERAIVIARFGIGRGELGEWKQPRAGIRSFLHSLVCRQNSKIGSATVFAFRKCFSPSPHTTAVFKKMLQSHLAQRVFRVKTPSQIARGFKMNLRS